jgi:tetratricopeptide (TPR) repeat protein
MLLGGAAYWYAANKEGAKAVELARKAIETDPRFIWSHIALARGYLAQDDPIAAEKTLIAARRYGNFPTLEYEIASARLAAGLYREAGEELAKSFKVVDGTVQTKLGGRVERSSTDITELVGSERRASIFAPAAAESPGVASRLIYLLELRQELAKSDPNADLAWQAADNFIKGSDKMKVHRQMFAAAQLLEKKIALPRVVEISRDAITNVDAGLDIPGASTTVMASELYQTRALAAIRNEYVNVPDVPRSTLSAILRGRIEEISGWVAYQMEDADEAVLRLRRAISVLPPNSAWWRSSTWRLGSALELAGKSSEALDFYIKSYKSENTAPDTIKYSVISALYQRLNGSTDGLEEKISAVQTENESQLVARQAEPAPTQQQPAVTEAESSAAPPSNPAPFGGRKIPAVVPIARPVTASPTPIPVIDATPEPTPVADIETPQPTPEATPAASLLDTPAVIPAALPENSLPESLPLSPMVTPEPNAEPTPEAIIPDATPEPTETPAPSVTPEVTPGPPPEAPPEEEPVEEVPATPEPTQEPTPSPTPANDALNDGRTARSALSGNGLFPPVVITIPQKRTARSTEPVPTPSSEPVAEMKVIDPPPLGEGIAQNTKPPRRTRPRVVIEGMARPADVRPCVLTVSDDAVSLQTGGRDVAVVIGREDDAELDGLTASTSSPQDVSVRREPITGVVGRALFVLRSISEKTGNYQAVFETPCGRREIAVNVR